MMYSLGSGKMEALTTAGKNELSIGRVLQRSGYGDGKLVIVGYQSFDSRFGSGQRYVCVDMDTKKKSLQDAVSLKFLAEKKDGRIAVYITDEYVSCDDVIDLFEASKAKDEADAKASAEKAEAKRQLLSDLPKMYPMLQPVEGSKKGKGATGSANLKKELQRAFPGVAFSVRYESYSMGCSISVGYQDGPTSDEVDAIADKYQYADFDGSTDSTIYRDNAFEEVFGGAKYVSVSRSISAEKFEECAKSLGYSTSRDQYGCVVCAEFRQTEEMRRLAYKTSFYKKGA